MAAKCLQNMQDTVGREGEAVAWGADEMPPSTKAYYVAILAKEFEKPGGLRSQREAHSLCVILDHLAQGRVRAAADTAAMRLMAVELANRKDWEEAQHLELVPPEGSRLVSKDLQYMAKREADFDRRLQSRAGFTSKGGWQTYGDGKGKSDPWSGKAFSKGKKGAKKGGKGWKTSETPKGDVPN